MICRKSVAAMRAAGEDIAFVSALIQLKDPAQAPSIIPQAQVDGATSRYDDYVWMHKAAFSLIHVGPAFGPWHREILRQFELDIRDVANNDNLYVPYWDWPNGNSSGDAGWPFVNDLMGGLGVLANNYEVAAGAFAGSTGDWPIRVKDNADTHVVLRRVHQTSATSNSIPSLLSTRTALSHEPYDSIPYNDNNFPTTAQAAASFRKSLEFFLHNGPHNWVGAHRDGGGNLIAALDMLARSSPNDPVFFLHHAAIDRIWQIWQERQKATNNLDPNATFAPASGANPGHNLNNTMDIADQAFFNWPVNNTNFSNLDLHGTGVWYDSDVPAIINTTPSVSFGTIPAGMTTYRPVQFDVTGCRMVQFRITGISGGAFTIPPGQVNLTFPASDTPATRQAEMFISCAAPANGDAIPNGSATIEAFIVDTNGYLTGTAGTDFIIDTYTITFNALVETRKTTAVSFVSDRSGSMIDSVGGGLTKFDLLEEALEVATDLLDTDDSAALVFFDSATSVPLTISTLGNGNAIEAALNNPTIQPNFGSTGIGLGLIEGANQLDDYVPPVDVLDPNYAVVCLTDGNQNTGPTVDSVQVTTALASYANDVYAIGLGTEGGVSEDTLGAISNYMMLTGEIDVNVRRYKLTKYFVQIVADIKKANIILDPEGVLYPGITHEVHFNVSEAEVSFDIILLSSFAKYIELGVVTPGGNVLSHSAMGPNASIRSNRLDTIFKVGLPALPASPLGSHAGRWTVKMRIVRSKDKGNAMTMALLTDKMGTTNSGRGIPYNVLIQTRSNLSMSIGKQKSRVLLGEKINLALSLAQYGIALKSAEISATVTDPHGNVQVHKLSQQNNSMTFTGSIPALLKGVYSVRIIANGMSLGNNRFTREATRNYAVGHPVVTTGTPPDSSQNDDLCKLVACLLKNKAILKWGESKGVDLKELKKCLTCVCDETDRPEEKAKDPCDDATIKRTTRNKRSIDMPAVQLQELVNLITSARDEQTGSGIIEAPVSVDVPKVDPALFDKTMFMPVMAWDKDGKVIKVTDGKMHKAMSDKKKTKMPSTKGKDTKKK